jgi:pimeloyl-ACP methyl ester carboxylesterase
MSDYYVYDAEFESSPLPVPSVRVRDIEISFVDEGSGKPVVLLHGFPLNSSMWIMQLSELDDVCRVIVPDLRGFGDTSLGNVDPTTGISMTQYADDLAALLDACGIQEPIVLCGFSMGGYIAFQFVKSYSDRLRGLVLCDTRAAADTEEARAGRIKMAEHVGEWGAERVAEIMGPKLFAPETFAKQPELVEDVRRVVMNTLPDAIAAAQRGMAARPDVTSELPSINVPTLVIAGEHDAISPPEEMRAIAAAIPGAEFVLVPGAGHMSPMENSAVVNDALRRFIARLV